MQMHLDEEARWLQWCGWYETVPYRDHDRVARTTIITSRY
jgi:hypothetical protein